MEKREKFFTSELIKLGEFEFRGYVYVDDESNLGAFLRAEQTIKPPVFKKGDRL
jgi:hypothetical protein